MLKYYRILAIPIAILLFFTQTGFSSAAAKKTAFNNIIICIDPGHQLKGETKVEPIAPGSKIMKAKVTSGTRGVKTKTPEYEINLEIALKVRDILKKDGFVVVMTRDKNDVKLSNIERAEIANKVKANLFLRIHADGSLNKKVNGVSILYPSEKSSTSINISNQSKMIASIMLNSVTNQTGAKSNGVVGRNDMTGFNWCKVPAVLIETGFMTNTGEDEKLGNNKYQETIAQGIERGIVRYFSDMAVKNN